VATMPGDALYARTITAAVRGRSQSGLSESHHRGEEKSRNPKQEAFHISSDPFQLSKHWAYIKVAI
jgi:hypothetical protein